MPSVQYRNADGSTGEIDVNQLQQFDPQLYSQYLDKIGQPSAGLQSTQTSTAATATGTKLTQREVDQNNFITQTQQGFDSSKDKNGYVNPQTYNQARDKATSLGISTDDFDKQFGTNYVDPNNVIGYNTPQGLSLRTQKSTLEGNIDQPVNDLLKKYSQLKMVGSMEGQFANNPLAKMLGMGGAERNYENERNTTIQSIQSLLDKANFSGFKLNKADLENVTNLLPSITDSSDQAKSKLSQLDGLLKQIAPSGVHPDVMDSQGLKSGLEKIPGSAGGILKGLMGDILNPGIEAINKTEQATAQAVNNPANKGNLLNSILSAGQATGSLAGNAASTIPSDIATAATAEAPGIVKGALGKVLGPVMTPAEGKVFSPAGKFLNYLTTTQGRTGTAMEKAVGKGGSLDWDTITANAREQIANKGTSAKQALERLINQETPAQLGNAQLSSSEGFELRKGLGARLPNNFFEQALQKASTGKNVQNNQAIEALRNSVSDELKRAAPDIKGPDEMYTFIKRMHGDAPAWGKRILGAVAFEQAMKYLPTPLQSVFKQLPL